MRPRIRRMVRWGLYSIVSHGRLDACTRVSGGLPSTGLTAAGLLASALQVVQQALATGSIILVGYETTEAVAECQ
jgi:hypothetical protein